MKLYLSSHRVPNLTALLELTGKPSQDVRLALIPNAKDYYAGKARAFKRRQSREYFEMLGFKVSVIDLTQFDNGEDLKAALSNFDIVWATGGNTFILRYEMRRSGFDEIITSLLDEGAVYGGESAGAIVAGNSLDGVEYADEPDFAEEVIKYGLKLTNHFVLPHVDSADFLEAIDKARQLHINDNSTIELTDTQAMVVNGDYIQIVNTNP